MKNLSLFSAVSVLALTLGSQALFAAEREVPAAEQPAAAPERAAPARERAAPARERAAPARERAAPSARRTAPARERAQPTRTTSTQSSSTSWTGSQAGGFGGGNASAGGFSDPVIHQCAPAVITFGSFGPSPAYATCSPGVPFSFSNSKGGFTGGGFIAQNMQIGNMVVGIEGDIAGKSIETSYVQPSATTVAYGPTPSGGFSFGFSTPTATRTDLISGSVRQGTDGSIRPRIGILLTPWSLLYLTGGIAFEHISASYTYFSTTTYTNLFVSGFAAPQGAVDTLAGSGSVDKTLTGGTVGAGYEVAIAYGLKLRLEYRWTGFGGLSFDVPLARTCTGLGCGQVAAAPASTSAHIDVGNVQFHTFRAGVGFGF
jgi:opacity protein-like surface antigen